MLKRNQVIWKSEPETQIILQQLTMKKILTGRKLRQRDEALQCVRDLCAKNGFEPEDIEELLNE